MLIFAAANIQIQHGESRDSRAAIGQRALHLYPCKQSSLVMQKMGVSPCTRPNKGFQTFFGIRRFHLVENSFLWTHVIL